MFRILFVSFTKENDITFQCSSFHRYVSYLARAHGSRVLALTDPAVPCRKTVYLIDYFGTGDVVSHMVVQDTRRKGRNIYSSSNTCKITLRSNCLSQHFSIIILAFRVRSVLVCFVYISEKIIFLNNITRFYFIRYAL